MCFAFHRRLEVANIRCVSAEPNYRGWLKYDSEFLRNILPLTQTILDQRLLLLELLIVPKKPIKNRVSRKEEESGYLSSILWRLEKIEIYRWLFGMRGIN